MIKSLVIFGIAGVLVNGLHVKVEHEDNFPDRLTMQADNGAYLSRCNNCGLSEFEDSASLHETNPAFPWANWKVERVDRRVALKGDNGKYLALCENCWENSTSPDAVFVNADTPTDNALWTLSNLGNGGQMWAFKANNGKWLARCNKCVEGGAYDNFAFANDDNPSVNRNAQWLVKGEWNS